MGAQFTVVVVDDGELDDVRELLLELGVEFAHLRGGAVPSQLAPPGDLFIATLRHAGLARSWSADEGRGRPVCIAFTSEDSPAARNALRKMGFAYLVRRPVHPLALRLLLLHALYRGEERRREPRVPVGYEVSVRSGLRRREALLVDLSSRGCRLLADRAVSEGSKLTLHLPPQFCGSPSGRSGDDTLTLSGRVVRCVADGSSPLDGCYSVAVQFAALEERDRLRLERALAAHAQALGAPEAEVPPAEPPAAKSPKKSAVTRTPGIEPVGATAPSAHAAAAAAARRPGASRAGEEPAPEAAPPPAAPLEPAEPGDRRRHARGRFAKPVIAAAQEAMHRMLIGHDLGIGGMRVERHPDLQIGQRLRLALYDAARETPIVVDAVVARDDGEHLALHFEDLGESNAARLEHLVATLPPVERLSDGETGALGTVLSEIVSQS
jgi:hypothetical protein